MGINNGGYTVFLNLTPAEFKHISALINYSESEVIADKVRSEMGNKFHKATYAQSTDALYEAIRHAEDRVENGHE